MRLNLLVIALSLVTSNIKAELAKTVTCELIQVQANAKDANPPVLKLLDPPEKEEGAMPWVELTADDQIIVNVEAMLAKGNSEAYLMMEGVGNPIDIGLTFDATLGNALRIDLAQAKRTVKGWLFNKHDLDAKERLKARSSNNFYAHASTEIPLELGHEMKLAIHSQNEGLIRAELSCKTE